MKPTDFSKEAPGELLKVSDRYWAFVPRPLPPRLTWDEELVSAVAEANLGLGELGGIGRRLPNPHLFIGPFTRREAVLSSRIEGTRTTVGELLLFEAAPVPTGRQDDAGHDAQEVSNYVRALEGGLRALADSPITLTLIRQLHHELMSGVRGEDKDPGAWRGRQVVIAPEAASASAADARFVPPPPEMLPSCLDALADYIRNPPGMLPPLLRIALVHYQFEAIHPFSDGNGRVGRLLITLMLCAEKLLPQPLLYLSDYFERNRRAYYDGLLQVSQAGAWEPWLKFFLRGVAQQAADAVRRADRLADLRDEFRRSCQSGQSAKTLAMLDELFASPVVNASGAAKTLKMTQNGAQNIIDRLEELGILREVTGRQRNRVYVAERIVRILEEPSPVAG